jgi:hypothetical protein
LSAQDHSTQLETIFSDNVEYARLKHIKSALDVEDNIHLVFMGNEGQIIYGTNKSGSW